MADTKNDSSWSLSNVRGSEWASAGASGMAALMKGDAHLISGRFDEKQQIWNAAQADRAAEESILKGERQVDDIRRKTKQIIGDQRAAFAAQGIDINDGSAADVQEDTQYWGVMDEMTTRNNAFLESYGYKVQALNLRTQADITRVSTDYKYRMSLVEGGMDAAKQIGAAMAGGGGGGAGA